MFRILAPFIITVFLFLGIVATANLLLTSENYNDINVVAQISEKKDPRLTIKEIESVTSSNNYHFTSSNALR
jgi:hypothetical protein